MPLTDVTCKTAKPKDKAYKLADGYGMFLLVKPNGTKCWQLKYRFLGKEKLLSLGVYPTISLVKAREQRDLAKRLLVENIDPSAAKKQNKLSLVSAHENTFEGIAREWYLKNSANWTAEYGQTILKRLEKNIFPWLGSLPINEVNAHKLLYALRRVEEKGTIETAHRVLQHCGQVFRYAVVTLRAERDPTADLKGALEAVKANHFATITDPKEVKALLLSINDYKGSFITKCALKLAPLLFVRPGELRHAEWSEFDFEKAEWRIPGEKMKMGRIHIVPLAKQALEILKELHALTGEKKYVFPSTQYPDRPMSENTVIGALRRLGYEKGEMTGHGFRSMASTLLNEQGWNRDAIERQLAHAERDKVRAAYNYADYLPERRDMMQAWGNYLENLIQD